MKRHTKIVCTIGPSVNSPEKIEALIDAGMNVARLNFSHGTHDEHRQVILNLKQAREKLKVPLAIMLDTKGPEIRIGKLKDAEIHLKQGERFLFVKEPILGTKETISLTPPHVIDALKEGMVMLLDNGYIITHVVEVTSKGVKVEVDHGGIINSNKGVNIPQADIELPALTAQDIEDIRFGCRESVDIIAASFIRSAEHVMSIKKLLEDEKKSEILVISKIENRQGVENIDSIIQSSDGIMVARGDLGVELPLSEVPRLQKMMIRKCYLAGKPSVTATQMLESMIFNPRPTRAEVSDVANAIYDSTSAVMLSGETAVGRYPIETVKMMTAIIEETERDFDYYDFLKQNTQRSFPDVPSSVSLASIKTAYNANARAIFAFTTSGSTARLLSRFRPEMPIIAMTSSLTAYHQLSISWGVVPLFHKETFTVEEAYKPISEFALQMKYVKYGDLVVITAGTPFGHSGTTNMMIIDSIGDVLVRGNEGMGPKVVGKIAVVTSPESTKEYHVKGKIMVINSCDESYTNLLKCSLGVILQNHVEDIESEWFLKKYAEEFNLSVIFRAEGSNSLREEQLVTLDPEQAIIYKGSIQ